MWLIPPINSIISQVSKEKYGLVVTRQAAFLAKMGTGTSWEFSQSLLLDHVFKETELSLREIIMQIKSSRFPGHPVFHAVDPTWGSDNSVNFNFHPENEAEARMYIAGLVPYIRDMRGEHYLKLFSSEAIDRHMDSVFDETTKQIYSNTDIWVNNSLALDEKCNFTDVPVASFSNPHPFANESPTPTVYRDTDSVSTFRSKVSMNIKEDKQTQAMESQDSYTKDRDALSRGTSNMQKTHPANIKVESSSRSQAQDLSGLTEDPRVTQLEEQFKWVTTDLLSTISKITEQQALSEANFQQLF
jgi:hypothetical protein